MQLRQSRSFRPSPNPNPHPKPASLCANARRHSPSEILLKWCSEHDSHPYPGKEEKERLRQETGFNSCSQIQEVVDAKFGSQSEETPRLTYISFSDLLTILEVALRVATRFSHEARPVAWLWDDCEGSIAMNAPPHVYVPCPGGTLAQRRRQDNR